MDLLINFNRGGVMKKLIIVLIALILCVACAICVVYVFRSHEHDYSRRWKSNDDQHWQICSDCGEKSEKEDHSLKAWENDDEVNHKRACECGYKITEAHTFDDGVVTIKPTVYTDGEIVFTCTVCGAEKKDVVYLAVTELDVWHAAHDESIFENVTMKMTLANDNMGLENDPTVCIYKFVGDLLHDSDTGRIYESEATATVLSCWLDMMMENYDIFSFDPETGAYVASEEVVFDMTVFEYTATITASDLSISLGSSGKVESVSCHMIQDVDSGEYLEFDLTMEFSEYGTTVLPEEN